MTIFDDVADPVLQPPWVYGPVVRVVIGSRPAPILRGEDEDEADLAVLDINPITTVPINPELL